MADSYDDNDEPVVICSVNDPVIPRPNSQIATLALELLYTHWVRVERQSVDFLSDAFLIRLRKPCYLTERGRQDCKMVGHNLDPEPFSCFFPGNWFLAFGFRTGDCLVGIFDVLAIFEALEYP